MPVVLADFVDGADVGMIERRRRARLPPKALQRQWILGYIFGQELQGNEAAEFGVLRLIDDTHAAAAQLLHNAVARDGLPNHAGTAMVGGRWEASQRRVGIRDKCGQTGVYSLVRLRIKVRWGDSMADFVTGS